MVIRPTSKLLMIGDSITDCNRARPVGEAPAGGLGQGYVALVDALLTTKYPDYQIRVQNVGTSGETVRHLAARWQHDVLDLRPDFVSVLIGINDVWRQFDSPLRIESHVYLEEYELTLDTLVVQTLPHVAGMTLMTPFFLELSTADPMRATMDLYGQAVKRIAQRHKTRFIDIQSAFDQLMQYVYGGTLALDRVHPSMAGHMLIADAFIEEITR